ncbi:MAG: carboxypeptidase regulatory-like domain-containing protein, partial [Acidobacteriaceae bacterium]|nr:carboxypeptidase regulatory-like domain-containing protein [Acidobacteriaceae bacterium]
MFDVRKGFLFCLLGVLGLLLCVSSVQAQQIFGSIYGTVTDPSGSPVNNAKVTVTDVTKGTAFEVNTNDTGIYTKTNLIPDQYTVTIEAPGFQKTVSNPITVQVDQASKFDAALQVGNVNQTVEVTAAVPLLQTDRADV